jgi:hypothetical protein
MVDVEINDVRSQKEFKGISFSEFKKTDVKKELLHSLISSKIEPACYWCAELICAGHYGDVWETIIHFYAKHIHLGNPKIAAYLDMRISHFKDILTNGYLDSELRLRNNSRIRKLFCEIMCVLCDAKRKHSYDKIRVKKDDFDLTLLRDKFKATSNEFAQEIYLNEDPKELFPAINELGFNISEPVKNIMNACYWVEWIMEFETLCKAKTKASSTDKLFCERRMFAKVDGKCQKDIIWMIWDLFLNESNKRSKFVNKTMESLLNLFCLRYTSGCHKKRKHILYFAISLLCETHVNAEEEIIRTMQQEVVTNVIKNIDLIYAQIKLNEYSPGTDYLFKNLKTSNLEKTIAKLETMNTFGESFVPRLNE